MSELALPASTVELSERLGQKLLARGWFVATAESCTGGGIAAAITSVAGSSRWFECGIVSYANAVKTALLHVNSHYIETQGAVSEPVVLDMVTGVLNLASADVAVATSGIAGPSGGTESKPVGMVWIAWGLATGERRTQCFHFHGDRQSVQAQAVEQAIRGLLAMIEC